MEKSKPGKFRVCVDLDGVLAEYDSWRGIYHIGQPIPGAVEFTRVLKERCMLIIHTTRMDLDLQRTECPAITIDELRSIVKEYLDEHGFHYDEIWTGTGKPIASAYIDDRAINCKPQEFGHREYASALSMVFSATKDLT